MSDSSDKKLEKYYSPAYNKIAKEWIYKDKQVEIIGLIIFEAFLYWERANNQDDFCVQDVSMGVIVFGGLNRVIWNFQKGFKIDAIYCSESFLNANKDYL